MRDEIERDLIVYGKQRRLPGFDYANPDVAFFVTIRVRSGTAPFTDPRLASEVIAALDWLRANRGITIYAYCLMPDHLHLLLRLASDGKTLGEVMATLKTFTTKQSWKLGWSGQLWQNRFHDHVLRRSEIGARVAVYILQNPMRKGLAQEIGEYRWSGTPDPL